MHVNFIATLYSQSSTIVVYKIKNQKESFNLNFYQNYKDCLPQLTYKFISDIVSAYVSLKLIDRDEFINYSLNYQPFDVTDRFLVYVDFIKESLSLINF